MINSNEMKEILQIVSLCSVPFYDKYYINIPKNQVINNPFKSGNIHPVVKRLEITKSEDHLDYFQKVITYSEKFGQEQGYITQNTKKRIDLLSPELYKELQKRKEISLETINSITTCSKVLEDTIRSANDEYISYLLDLGYIKNEIRDYDRDTQYFMIHPLYIQQWKRDGWKSNSSYPSWAVKEIGYFPDK